MRTDLEKENADRVARMEAKKLARKLGDEAWVIGNTKHALEAYEASDITPEELLEMAEKLLKAEQLMECLEEFRHGEITPIASRYLKQIFQLLGWNVDYRDVVVGYLRGKNVFMNATFYRAASLACLKLIKRI